MKLLIPIIFVVAAVAAFMSYTNPTYQHIKELQVQYNSYDEALTKAQELRTLRDDLLKQKDSFDKTNLDRLSRILPDNVDNIRLIIDISNIAGRHHLTLSNVDLGDLSHSKDTTAEGAAQSSDVGSLVVKFAVSSADYDNFLAFLQDLEHSLRLLDIQKINFITSSAGATTYTVEIRTYWLH